MEVVRIMNRNRMVDRLLSEIRNDLMFRTDETDFLTRFNEIQTYLGILSYDLNDHVEEFKKKKTIVIVDDISPKLIGQLQLNLKKHLGWQPEIKLINYERTQKLDYEAFRDNHHTDLIVGDRDHEAKDTKLLDSLINRNTIENKSPKVIDCIKENLKISLTSLFEYIIYKSAYLEELNVLKENLKDYDQ